MRNLMRLSIGAAFMLMLPLNLACATTGSSASQESALSSNRLSGPTPTPDQKTSPAQSFSSPPHLDSQTTTKQTLVPLEKDNPAARNDQERVSKTVSFSDFTANIDAEVNKFELEGIFTLGAESDGINLFKEDVGLRIGTFSLNISAGSFKPREKGRRKGVLQFETVIESTAWKVGIHPLGKNSFALEAQLEGTTPSGQLKPLDVGLTIGDDSDSAKTLTYKVASGTKEGKEEKKKKKSLTP